MTHDISVGSLSLWERAGVRGFWLLDVFFQHFMPKRLAIRPRFARSTPNSRAALAQLS
jgi:hypothetical protein